MGHQYKKFVVISTCTVCWILSGVMSAGRDAPANRGGGCGAAGSEAVDMMDETRGVMLEGRNRSRPEPLGGARKGATCEAMRLPLQRRKAALLGASQSRKGTRRKI